MAKQIYVSTDIETDGPTPERVFFSETRCGCGLSHEHEGVNPMIVCGDEKASLPEGEDLTPRRNGAKERERDD